MKHIALVFILALTLTVPASAAPRWMHSHRTRIIAGVITVAVVVLAANHGQKPAQSQIPALKLKPIGPEIGVFE